MEKSLQLTAMVKGGTLGHFYCSTMGQYYTKWLIRVAANRYASPCVTITATGLNQDEPASDNKIFTQSEIEDWIEWAKYSVQK